MSAPLYNFYFRVWILCNIFQNIRTSRFHIQFLRLCIFHSILNNNKYNINTPVKDRMRTEIPVDHLKRFWTLGCFQICQGDVQKETISLNLLRESYKINARSYNDYMKKVSTTKLNPRKIFST